MTRRIMLHKNTLLCAGLGAVFLFAQVPLASAAVVTSMKPLGFIAAAIADGVTDTQVLLPDGASEHDYSLRPSDVKRLQNADLVVWIGPEMEAFMDKSTQSIAANKKVTIAELEGVKPLLMTGADDDDDHDGHEMDIEYDEHIWTSPANAMKLVEVITETLKEVSPENASYFEENKNSYETELKSLDDEFKDIVANGRHRMIVVADKFPFRYFAQEYGLSYRAAFSGCSTDTEPSAKTIAYLIDRIKENQIQAVFYLELSSHRTADIISEETGAKPLLLHSCHNVTRRQFDEGVTYLQLMKQNAKNLQEALL